MSLRELESKSILILREVRAQFDKPGILWSTGKDSTATLSLVRDAFLGEIPWDVIHIDTSFKFPEIYQFRDRLAEEWGFRLVIASNRECLEAEATFPHGKVDRLTCCTALKTLALRRIVDEGAYDAIVVSIRRDEHGIRGKERYMSPREKDFRWEPYRIDAEGSLGTSGITSATDMELHGWGLFESDFGDVHHVRVHPLLHWSELDVWKYTEKKGLPVNPLYFARNGKRYRSLGCMPCTSPFASEAGTIYEIISELKATRSKEREGRAQDKEQAFVMQKLRSMGYM